METLYTSYAGPAPAGLILKTLRALRHLRLEDQIAFFELILKCKDPSHELFHDTLSPLTENALANDDGSVDEVIRLIVLSAILEEDDDTYVVSERG